MLILKSQLPCDQIGNIIIIEKEKLDSYDIDKHKSNVRLAMSSNNKEVWFGFHDDFVKDIELKGYMEIGDWKNSPEQRDLIVNYNI